MILKPDFDIMACCEAVGLDIFDLGEDLGVDTHDLNWTEVKDEVESVLTAQSFTKKDFFEILKGYEASDDVIAILDGTIDDGADPSLPEFKMDPDKIRVALGTDGFDLRGLAEDCSVNVSDLDKDDILEAIMDNWRARTWTEEEFADIANTYGAQGPLKEGVNFLKIIAKAKTPEEIVQLVVEDAFKKLKKDLRAGLEKFDAITNSIEYVQNVGGELGLTQNEVRKAWRLVLARA